MMLIEEGALATAALPIAELRAQLNLSSADGGAADVVLEPHLRAAIAAIEGRTGKVLISRRFRWRIGAWRDGNGQPLPLSPVSQIHGLSVLDADEVATSVSPERWQLRPDLHRPRLAFCGSAPAIPNAGWAEIDFSAGLGASWADVPADLRQAVLMLAARYFEDRAEAGLGQHHALPFGVMSLIERFRSVRILGGGKL